MRVRLPVVQHIDIILSTEKRRTLTPAFLFGESMLR